MTSEEKIKAIKDATNAVKEEAARLHGDLSSGAEVLDGGNPGQETLTKLFEVVEQMIDGVEQKKILEIVSWANQNEAGPLDKSMKVITAEEVDAWYKKNKHDAAYAEKVVLASMLRDRVAALEVEAYLLSTDFSLDRHRKIFSAIAGLLRDNKNTDIVTLVTDLAESGRSESVGGAAYLASLLEGVPSATNVMFFAKAVKNEAKKRGRGR